MVLEEVSASSAKETEVEEISVLLTVLHEEPLSLEYWRTSPETRAEERVALMVRPSLSVVMKSVELFPESVEMESMEMVVVGAAVSTESVHRTHRDCCCPRNRKRHPRRQRSRHL